VTTNIVDIGGLGMPSDSPPAKKSARRALRFHQPKTKAPDPKSTHCVVHPTGHIVAMKGGKRVPELELKPLPVLWAEHAAAQGHDPTKFTLHLQGRKIHIVEQIDGYTFRAE